MNTPQPNVLVLPPHPPAPVNTVLWAVAGLILGVAASLTFHSINLFPNNAPVEALLAGLSSFLMFVLAFIFGLRAVVNETKRTQFQHVVTRYASMTGDKRYLPYILPTHTALVSSLFAISMVISGVIPLISWMTPNG